MSLRAVDNRERRADERPLREKAAEIPTDLFQRERERDRGTGRQRERQRERQ